MDYKVSENELDKELQDKINNKNATSLNNKTAEDFLLKEDYKKDSANFALDNNVKQELSSLKSAQESQSNLIQNNKKEINNLKTSVDNGKSSLYSAIIGKKVTPRSKDFADLKNAIDGIKLGQGNAQASEVLSGKTFTNDSGIVQTGTIPNMGNKDLIPKEYAQELGMGFYDKINFKGFNDLDTNTLQGILNIILPKFKNNLIDIINKIIPNNDIPTFQYKGMKFESVTLPSGQQDTEQNPFLNFTPKYAMVKDEYKDNGIHTNWRLYPISRNSSCNLYNRGREISISYSYGKIRWCYADRHHSQYTFDPIEIYFFSDLPIK